jgi:hypothetical protein
MTEPDTLSTRNQLGRQARKQAEALQGQGDAELPPANAALLKLNGELEQHVAEHTQELVPHAKDGADIFTR